MDNTNVMQVSEREKERYMTQMGKGGKRIIHYEHWSNPDAETYLTGIDYYERPRECRQRLLELYPMLDFLKIPESNAPKKRPTMDLKNLSSNPQNHSVRWGEGESGTYLHGERFFKTEEDVFAFHPLQHPDFTDWHFVNDAWDYSSEEVLYERFRKDYPAVWGDKAPAFSTASCAIYNTMFMWPLLTFGWELFLATCLEDEFAPVMEEFAELNRREFRAFSRLPVNFCSCHDDIAITRGPVCSMEWMERYIFSRYEEFWSILREKGITILFTSDGKPDVFVDALYRCGMRGLTTEPYCDFKAVAKKYPDIYLGGEGDNRVLTYGSKEDIRKMVESMAETGKRCGGYFMCIGNHIPWNVPGESIKYYLDYSDKYAWR